MDTCWAIWGRPVKHLAVFVFFVISAIILLGAAPLMAQDANDTIIINVNISQSAAIEVLPTTINWRSGDEGSVAPGSNGSVQNVSIKNIGSYNLTNFYIDMNTEDLETFVAWVEQ